MTRGDKIIEGVCWFFVVLCVAFTVLNFVLYAYHGETISLAAGVWCFAMFGVTLRSALSVRSSNRRHAEMMARWR